MNRRMTKKARRRENIVYCVEVLIKMAIAIAIMLFVFSIPEMLCRIFGI